MAMKFKRGEQVEIWCNEEGFEDSYFPATIISEIDNEYIVQYNTLLRQDEQCPLREFRKVANIRPVPPKLETIKGYHVKDVVDAYANDGWWKGTVVKMSSSGRDRLYHVKFGRGSQKDEIGRYTASCLRVHYDWIDVDGTWAGPFLRMGEDGHSLRVQPTRKGTKQLIRYK